MIELIEDLSTKDRIDRNLSEFLASNEYCYVTNYPCKYFDTNDLGAKKWTLNLDDINKIINLNYQLITTKDSKLQRFVGNIVDVIQSVDKWGVKAPLCLSSPITAHPGNKRLIVSRYLGKKTVPVIGLKNFFVDNSLQMTKIKTIDDLYKIFGKEISINISESNFLEVFYHGESHMRDKDGMDNFTKKAGLVRLQNKLCSNISDYLLQNGLEIVCGFNKKKKTKKIYKTFYSNKPTNKLYIEVLDNTILNNNLNFWELFFHFDYENRIKVCKTKKLKLVNTLSLKDNVVYNCSLYATLTRQKIYL